MTNKWTILVTIFVISVVILFVTIIKSPAGYTFDLTSRIK